MSNNLQRLNQALDSLENAITKKLSASASEELDKLKSMNSSLQQELLTSQDEYQKLKETSKEVINELNNSIQIIEDYFKKQNANSQNT
jgi:hypothetical protein